MQITGSKVTIGTNVEHTDKVESIHILSATQNNTQVNMQPQVSAPVADTGESSAHKIRLNDKKGNRVNLYRVIAAMHAHGFFKSEFGESVDQQDVFAAFANMLGDPFKDYHKNLSQGKRNNHDSEAATEIFDLLKKDFKDSFVE